MGSVLHFTCYHLKRVFTSPKPYITFLVIYAVLRTGLGGASTYLTENSQTFQAVEIFVFAHSCIPLQLIFILGLLFLLGDAPFLHEGISLQLIRTTRSRFLAGQMLSCIIISVIYLLGIEVLLLLLFLPHISSQNVWSDAVKLSAQVAMGGTTLNMKMAIYFFMDVLKTGTPYAMFAITFLDNLLLYTFLLLAVTAFNLRFRGTFGAFAVISIEGIKLIQRYVLPYKPLWYLSPCSVVCWGEQPISRWGLIYPILFLLTLSCIAAMLSFRFMRSADLMREEHGG
jgi:hypothetical protein